MTGIQTTNPNQADSMFQEILLQISIMSSLVLSFRKNGENLTANHWKDFRCFEKSDIEAFSQEQMDHESISPIIENVAPKWLRKRIMTSNTDISQTRWLFITMSISSFVGVRQFCCLEKKLDMIHAGNKKHLFICPTSNESKPRKNWTYVENNRKTGSHQ